MELPTYRRGEIIPWTTDETRHFLEVARDNSLYPAFLMLALYGLRQGEVLGLRWRDLDFRESEIRVRQQLQRVGGTMYQGPLKTEAARRDLPLLDIARQALMSQQARQSATRSLAGSTWHGDQDGNELVFTTSSGRPVEPRNFLRSFHQICEKHSIRAIKMHHLRHTAATFLKNLGVPARDAQLIMGHSQISTTQQIYQHGDMGQRRTALQRVEEMFIQPVVHHSRQLGQTLAVKPRFLQGLSFDYIWSRRRDSNPRPAVYKTAALAN